MFAFQLSKPFQRAFEQESMQHFELDIAAAEPFNFIVFYCEKEKASGNLELLHCNVRVKCFQRCQTIDLSKTNNTFLNITTYAFCGYRCPFLKMVKVDDKNLKVSKKTVLHPFAQLCQCLNRKESRGSKGGLIYVWQKFRIC